MTPRPSIFNVPRKEFARLTSKKIFSYRWSHRAANCAEAALGSDFYRCQQQCYALSEVCLSAHFSGSFLSLPPLFPSCRYIDTNDDSIWSCALLTIHCDKKRKKLPCPHTHTQKKPFQVFLMWFCLVCCLGDENPSS